MARTKRERPKGREQSYNGSRVNLVSEEDLYSLPSSNVDIADYEVVDMHEVSVMHTIPRIRDTPADLLLAHHLEPVRLKGLVNCFEKDWLLDFPIVSGFSVEDGDHGPEGDCKIYALGNCRWYRIRSASKMFASKLREMHKEARMYWAIRDIRGSWMNRVDQTMDDKYSHLKEGTTEFTKAQEQVGVELECKDDESLHTFWKAIHSQDDPKPKEASVTKGRRLAMHFAKYLLHHMLIDRANLLWLSSRIFSELGASAPRLRNKLFMIYNINSKQVMTTHIKVEESTKVVEAQTPQDPHLKTLANDKHQPSLSSLSSAIIPANSETVQATSGEIVNRRTDSRKRKRSPSVVGDDALCAAADVPACNDKSRGWNDFEKTQRPVLAQMHPTLSKKSLHKKLAKLYQESKTVSVKSESDGEDVASPGLEVSVARSVLEQDAPSDSSSSPSSSSALFPWSNIVSNKPILRWADASRRRKSAKTPFLQITGINRQQSELTFETLQALLYEEEIDDLCLADMIHVWRRDFGEPMKKVIAIVTSFAKYLLQELSSTDQRDPSARRKGEIVMPENIWRSTTLYDQIYKIHSIDGQDSDLLAFVKWEERDIFGALTYEDGYWRVRDSGLQHSKTVRHLSPNKLSRVSVIIDLDIGEAEQENTTIDTHGHARKGRSSLRPRELTYTSKYIRNGAGPKPESSAEINAKGGKYETDSVYMADADLAAIDDDRSDKTPSVKAIDQWKTSKQFSQPVLDPIQQLRRHDSSKTPSVFAKLVVKRGPDTTGNNAGIWRCKMPSCYFFMDSVNSIESQQAIAEHYSAHADAALEGLDLLGEAGYGAKTTALLQKLESEAQIWTQAMNTDILLLND